MTDTVQDAEFSDMGPPPAPGQVPCDGGPLPGTGPLQDRDSMRGELTVALGEPEGVLDRRELFDYVECWSNGRWFEPPISLFGLARAFRVTPHHSSAMLVKRNLLMSTFIPHPLLDRDTFGKAVLDYLVLGNGYLQRVDNLAGRPLALQHALSKFTRRAVNMTDYVWIAQPGREYLFDPGSICHLLEPDINQEVYGVPEYLSALQSALLNENATLFRRRYYLNGSHAGFILYMNDAAQSEEDVEKVKEAMRASKGPGNFRNMFLYSPNGKKDGVQVIPISEVAAKDEFLGIKNTTRDDVLAAHRVPPQLLGVVPTNPGGFGDVGTAATIFYRNEIVPLQRRFQAINDWLGQEVVRFGPYEGDPPPAGPPSQPALPAR